MSRPKICWYSRGRDAFTEGRECLIKDGRINARDRAAWHEGFNRQRHLNSPQISESDRNEIIAEIQSIKDSL